ncbi:protein-glutamine glutaminase family protein [Longimicrobium sp.]|uniref:protein-glutamine glutaminase family protein n=1 Tax=Longimicrobium sp. TaxID=2029185 RepID=UPI002F94623B
MSEAETELLLRAAGSLPEFSPYLFSGCHDRAHAAYVLLPAAVRAKAGKVWLFPPARYTSAIAGKLGLNLAVPYGEKVEWGYHVALYFKTSRGDLVLDAALTPGQLISPERWFSMMKIPAPSFWTVLDGGLYLFNDSGTPSFGRPPWPHRNTNLMNGYFYRYEGDAAGSNRIPLNLARDAVGAALIAGGGCPALRAAITEPENLLELLRRTDLPADCAPLQERFRTEVQSWSQRLSQAR